jgi:hypothetical protein
MQTGEAMHEATTIKPEWWGVWHTVLLTIAATLLIFALSGLRPSPETAARPIDWNALAAIGSILAAFATAAATIVALHTARQAKKQAERAERLTFSAIAERQRIENHARAKAAATALMWEFQSWLMRARAANWLDILEEASALDLPTSVDEPIEKYPYLVSFVRTRFMFFSVADLLGYLPTLLAYQVYTAHEEIGEEEQRVQWYIDECANQPQHVLKYLRLQSVVNSAKLTIRRVEILTENLNSFCACELGHRYKFKLFDDYEFEFVA